LNASSAVASSSPACAATGAEMGMETTDSSGGNSSNKLAIAERIAMCWWLL